MGRQGALDHAGNEFDDDDTTPQREGTIISKLTIDGQGRTRGDYFTAAAHKSPSHYRASPPPPPPQLTRFQRFYPLYRAHIADLLAERERRAAESFRVEYIAAMRAAETRLDAREAALLAQLRARAQQCRDHRLTFDGEMLENEVCIPSSDAAARIFTRLLQEDRVTPLPACWRQQIGNLAAASECESADGMIDALKDYARRHPR